VKIVICFNNETFAWSRDGYIGAKDRQTEGTRMNHFDDVFVSCQTTIPGNNIFGIEFVWHTM